MTRHFKVTTHQSLTARGSGDFNTTVQEVHAFVQDQQFTLGTHWIRERIKNHAYVLQFDGPGDFNALTAVARMLDGEVNANNSAGAGGVIQDSCCIQ